MKSKLILKSEQRELFGTIVKQNTDSMLCLTDMVKSYNKLREKEGLPGRRVEDIIKYDTFLERLYYILIERNKITQLPDYLEDMINLLPSTFMESIRKIGVVKSLKKMKLWRTTGRGANREVYVDPDIFVMLALEMNPRFYAKVITWLSDGLIPRRIEAADSYNRMTKAIQKRYIEIFGEKPPQQFFINEAKRIREIATGDKDRNELTEEEYNKIIMLQELNTNLIKSKIKGKDRVKILKSFK